MESADDQIRVSTELFPEPVQNVEDSVVGAARKQHEFSAVPDHQRLLMVEAVLNHPVSLPTGQTQVAFGPAASARESRQDRDLFVQLRTAIQQTEPGQRQNGFVDADVARPLRVQAEIVPPGGLLQTDLRPGVDRSEGGDASGVIIVAVAQEQQVHAGKVHAQRCRIGQHPVAGASVRQNPVPLRLQIDAQAVLMPDPRRARRIFFFSDDPHSAASVVAAMVAAAALVLAFRGKIEQLMGVGLHDLMIPQTFIIVLAVLALVFLASAMIPARLFARIPVSSAFRGYKESKKTRKNVCR